MSKSLFMKKWVIAVMALILIGSLVPVYITDASQARGVPSANIIRNAYSDKVLGIGGDDKKSNGAHVVQWNDEDVNDQKWYIRSTGDGYKYIINVESGDYLDVSEASLLPGDKVIQWPYNGGWNQQWKIVAADEDGSYYIINRGSGLYLDTAYSSLSNGAQIVQQDFSDDYSQRWFIKLVYLSPGSI
ncbi:RICIN domain-containing protein [Paenibacillus yanchengensis]|uniref:RICIN domain-containing protein n=1 Tax=Paenibacillus yanchengensis TaxID=2035833 RepID=A0ABW4YM07_9BACL